MSNTVSDSAMISSPGPESQDPDCLKKALLPSATPASSPGSTWSSEDLANTTSVCSPGSTCSSKASSRDSRSTLTCSNLQKASSRDSRSTLASGNVEKDVDVPSGDSHVATSDWLSAVSSDSVWSSPACGPKSPSAAISKTRTPCSSAAIDITPCEEADTSGDESDLVDCFCKLAQIPEDDTGSKVHLRNAQRFLLVCQFCPEDICLVFAFATIYFQDMAVKCDPMQPGEAGRIAVLLTFMAHCYALDCTCPLKFWQEHLFRRYCGLATLSSALICMMGLRNHLLRVDDDELSRRLRQLRQAAGLVAEPSAAPEEEQA